MPGAEYIPWIAVGTVATADCSNAGESSGEGELTAGQNVF
jgi:hypothetical protein